MDGGASLVSLTNMPLSGTADGFPLRLIPYTLEHRLFGSEHWSYLACHGDRYEALAGRFSYET